MSNRDGRQMNHPWAGMTEAELALAFQSHRLSLAYHEAGHAVAVWRVGGVIEYLDWGWSKGGAVCWHEKRKSPIDPIDNLAVTYAGPRAEARHHRKRTAHPGDNGAARKLIRQYRLEPWMVAEAKVRARKIVQRDWIAIEACAKRSLECGYLDGREVERIIRKALEPPGRER
jgi:hypothetical protein